MTTIVEQLSSYAAALRFEDLPREVVRQATPLATAQYILVLHPSVQAATLNEFIALAKQKPGSLNYSSAGVGSPLHLAAELFKKRAGISKSRLSNLNGPLCVFRQSCAASFIFSCPD